MDTGLPQYNTSCVFGHVTHCRLDMLDASCKRNRISLHGLLLLTRFYVRGPVGLALTASWTVPTTSSLSSIQIFYRLIPSAISPQSTLLRRSQKVLSIILTSSEPRVVSKSAISPSSPILAVSLSSTVTHDVGCKVLSYLVHGSSVDSLRDFSPTSRVSAGPY